MRIVKGGNGGNIEVPGDDVVLVLKLTKSGTVNLQAPAMHPREACKVLFNVAVDLLFGSFQMQEQSDIIIPQPVLRDN